MPDEPNEAESDGIVIDEAERGAAFLDRSGEDTPSTLQLTSKPEREHRAESLARVERWEAGEDVPAVVNFDNPSDLRALLTDRRVELLQSVMGDQPDSIRGLAERLERDVKSVHDDLHLLEEYGIVRFERAGRAKRPFVPYESIEVNLEIGSPKGSDDPATV